MTSFTATRHLAVARGWRGRPRSHGSRTVCFATRSAPGDRLEEAKAAAMRTTFFPGLPR